MTRPPLLAAFRPLPLSIATMLVLLAVKLSGLSHTAGPWLASVGTTAGRSVLPSAIAAEPAHPAPAHPTPAKPEPAPVAATPIAAPTEAPPLPGPSETERALLQDLRARRELLETRDKAIESREALLKAAERALSDRLTQLTAMQARLEELEKSRRDLNDANWRGLVKTYETMRPRDAATIFNDLDQPVLMQVLDRMKDTKAAPVLAAMQPDRARLATTQLAQWRARAAGGS